MKVIIGILIPFFGTSLGAAFVFFMRKSLSDMLQRALTGFAAGVMVAASIWSLLIPAIDQSSEMGKWSFIPATVGFWAGMMFLLMLDTVIPHLHQKSEKAEGPKSQLKRTTMMILAVTLHNIPEVQKLLRQEHLHWHWELQSRICRRELLYPCRFVQRA